MSAHSTAKKHQDVEKLMQRQSVKLLTAGVLFILIGVINIVLAILQSTKHISQIPSWFNWIGTCVWVLVFVALYTRPVIMRLIRNSKDEYQELIADRAKARAFDFLSTGVLLAVFLGSNNYQGVLGFLAMTLGISWIIMVRKGGQLDA